MPPEGDHRSGVDDTAEGRARAAAEPPVPPAIRPPEDAAEGSAVPSTQPEVLPPGRPRPTPRVDPAAERLARRRRERRERERAERRRRDQESEERRERKRREREERDRAARAERERREASRAQRDAAERQRRLDRERARKGRTAKARARAAEARQGGRRRRSRRNAAAPRRAAAGSGAPSHPRASMSPSVAADSTVSTTAADSGPALVPTASHHHSSLKRPTVKVAVALAVVSAIAVGAGSMLGLPLPLLGDDGDLDATRAGAVGLSIGSISPGTPVGLTKGPYHPVVIRNPDYGESAAKFGADRGGRRHEGQDVFARPGTPLVAVRDGIVVDGRGGRNFYSYGGGNTLVIYSAIDNRSYVYLHMLRPPLVEEGEQVKAGQLVGQVGCTGSCDGPHLHFEIRKGRAIFGPQKKAFDPLPLLKEWPVRPAG